MKKLPGPPKIMGATRHAWHRSDRTFHPRFISANSESDLGSIAADVPAFGALKLHAIIQPLSEEFMEFEQITKRLEWLDDQERKSKASVSDLGKSLAALETTVNAISKQIKTITKEVSDLGPAAARLNQFDQILSKQRTELNRAFEEIEKNAQRHEREAVQQHQIELKQVNASVDGLRSEIDFESIKKQLKDQAMEDKRLSLAIQDIQPKIEEALKQIEAGLNISKESEETNRQNLKRITDIQAEMTAVRRRADEAREKTTLHTDSIRNLENRINELLESEAGRKEAQTAFLNEQVLAQVKRDRAWKDWQTKYEIFKKQAENMDLQVAALDDTIRAAKRSQTRITNSIKSWNVALLKLAKCSVWQRTASARNGWPSRPMNRNVGLATPLSWKRRCAICAKTLINSKAKSRGSMILLKLFRINCTRLPPHGH